MTPLLLIGCGNMGSALLARWNENLSSSFGPIMVVEPKEIPPHKNVSHIKHISELTEKFSGIVVIAVKPQQLDAMLPEVKKHCAEDATFLSIAAGKTLAYYEGHLGREASIVRAMPNTPAMIGQGMTVLVGNQSLPHAGRTQATQLMGAVGETMWLENEAQMDAVTAISGSGPAYFFYILECLTKSGAKAGLSSEQAAILALKTCAGSAALASAQKAGFAELRANVTSPGGTTEAALKVLQKDNALAHLIEDAVQAAIARAKEL